jgi:hypothetical protein
VLFALKPLNMLVQIVVALALQSEPTASALFSFGFG